jgi:hypothetical protein
MCYECEYCYLSWVTAVSDCLYLYVRVFRDQLGPKLQLYLLAIRNEVLETPGT